MRIKYIQVKEEKKWKLIIYYFFINYEINCEINNLIFGSSLINLAKIHVIINVDVWRSWRVKEEENYIFSSNL